MVDKLLYIFIGYSIAATYVIWVLSKRPTTHNEIDNLTQKTKRNRDSKITNDISPSINTKVVKSPKKEKKHRFKKWKQKRAIIKLSNMN